jgi:hypothetical protein
MSRERLGEGSATNHAAGIIECRPFSFSFGATTMQNLGPLLNRIATVLFVLVIVLYLGDYTLVRLRGGPLETVQINKFYAVPQKDGKTSFEPGEPETQTCVDGIFPHLGYSPCWYLRRHRNQQINL